MAGASLLSWRPKSRDAPPGRPPGSANGAHPGDEDPEHEILVALDRGDSKEALTLLMNLYGEPLYRFCRQMVSDEELAQDVHQMTFVQAYESLASFARRSSLRVWLYSIARHRALDALKILRRRRARFDAVETLPEPAAPQPDADERLAARGLRRALAQCLDALAPRAKMAVLLRFQEEISYVEMARLLSERAATLQARVARAMPVLRRCLEERGMTL